MVTVFVEVNVWRIQKLNYESQNVSCHLHLHKSQMHVRLHILLANVICFLSLKHRFQGLSMLFLFTWQSSVDWFGRQLMGFWTFHVHQNGGYFAKFPFFFYFTLVQYFKYFYEFERKTVSRRLSDNIVSSSTNSIPLQIYFLECLFLIIQLRRQVFKSFFRAFGL